MYKIMIEIMVRLCYYSSGHQPASRALEAVARPTAARASQGVGKSEGMSMSEQWPSTMPESLPLGSDCDESSEWPGGEGEDGRDLDEAFWDAFEVDDDEPQPEFGDFWYEREWIE